MNVCFANSKSEMYHITSKNTMNAGDYLSSGGIQLNHVKRLDLDMDLLTDEAQTCRERVINSSNNGVSWFIAK